MNDLNFQRLPVSVSFVDALAQMLLSRHAGDPMAMAGTLVLLPTRRACRSLREAFLRRSGGAPLLLPRIMPIGEVDNEADILAFASDAELCPAMPEHMRIALLTRLILKAGNTTPALACQLAAELARLLDETERYQLDLTTLSTLVEPKDLSEHWQKVLEFLSIITRYWPKHLEEKGQIDGTRITRLRVEALSRGWKNNTPAFPVIAAGSTGSIPATADLLITIAGMKDGLVILPGLDAEMSNDAWKQIDETHPQFGLKQLLGKAGVDRSKVPLLSSESTSLTLRALFAPAALTAQWSSTELPLAQDLNHIRLMQASTQIEEARMIAYQLRDALETPGKTAALITPDRVLARMVASECARYGLSIDDSAGQPLSSTPPAIFLELILEAAESEFAPGALLALLRHPFTALSQSPARAREYSRLLEKHFLRGVRFASGLDALTAHIKSEALSPEFTTFFLKLHETLRPLEMIFLKREAMPLSELLRILTQAAEALATSDDAQGADVLWSRESGNALSSLIAEWGDASAALGDILPQDLPALFGVLTAGVAVRVPFGTHPRLHILSPIEARLIHYDRVILGGMNEGSWPASITPDPWMSAPMRDAFGLPSHAVSIGMSAHDVWMLLHAPEVIISRPRKMAGAPQTASRWWVRLATLVGGKDKELLARMDISDAMQATLAAQDAPYDIPAFTRPEPVPPVDARPLRFSPSSIDLWRKEPYAFYAKKILWLSELPELDQEPDNREFGNKIHAALEHFSAEFPDALPDHAYQHLIRHGEVQFEPYIDKPSVAALWWPRFEAIARHWLEREALLRSEGPYHTRSEVKAVWELELAHQKISLTAKADRVDEMQDGFRLIDYKTGSIPSQKKLDDGEATQLPLTALALIRSATIQGAPSSMSYWELKTRPSGKKPVATEDAALVEQAEETFLTMVGESLLEDTSYPAGKIKHKDLFDEYEHLTRRAEWGGN